MSNTLFHFSFAVNDLDRARKFYGELLQCPEGRKVKGRLDFNFFGIAYPRLVEQLQGFDDARSRIVHIEALNREIDVQMCR